MAQPRAIESVEEPDLAAMQLTLVRGGIVWGIISAALVLLLYRQFVWAGVVGAIGLALFPWVRQAGKARRGTVRLDAEGIHKLAPLAWSVPWGDVASAELTDDAKTVLLTVQPKVPVRHWSRTFRRGENLPTGCYMATIYPELRNDMERYIAGRLGREAVLVEQPEVERQQAAAARRQAERAKARGPLRVITRDPVAMRAALIWVAVEAVAVAAVAWAMWSGQIVPIVVTGLAALSLAFPLSQALSTRKSDIKIDDDGIQRAGGWGWWFEWAEIASARVQEHAGVHYLVVTPVDVAAKPHRSRGVLPSGAAAANAVVAPVDEIAVERVVSHLKGRRYGK